MSGKSKPQQASSPEQTANNDSVAQSAASQRTTVLATAEAGATNGPNNAAAEAGSAAAPRVPSTASTALRHPNNTTVQGGTKLKPEQCNTNDAPPLARTDNCNKERTQTKKDAATKDADTVQQIGDAKPLPKEPPGSPSSQLSPPMPKRKKKPRKATPRMYACCKSVQVGLSASPCAYQGCKHKGAVLATTACRKVFLQVGMWCALTQSVLNARIA